MRFLVGGERIGLDIYRGIKLRFLSEATVSTTARLGWCEIEGLAAGSGGGAGGRGCTS